MLRQIRNVHALGAASSDNADGLVIDLGGGSSVTLSGLTTDDLDDMTVFI